MRDADRVADVGAEGGARRLGGERAWISHIVEERGQAKGERGEMRVEKERDEKGREGGSEGEG